MAQRVCEKHDDFEDACQMCIAASMPREGITCPFCGRDDYDQLGLKLHYLRGRCDVMEAITEDWTP